MTEKTDLSERRFCRCSRRVSECDGTKPACQKLLQDEIASGNFHPLPASCVLVWVCGMCEGTGRHTFGQDLGKRCQDCDGRPVRRYRVTEQISTPEPATEGKQNRAAARSAKRGARSS